MKKLKTISEKGLKFARRFTTEGKDPLTDNVEYGIRSSKIAEPDGTVVFEMGGIEAPISWSQLAVDIAASKYFKRAQIPTPEGRETSIKQLVTRVSKTIREFGEETGLNIVAGTLKFVGYYDEPTRDPRGGRISLSFAGKANGTPTAGDDASDVVLLEFDVLKKTNLAFDHGKILEDVIKATGV